MIGSEKPSVILDACVLYSFTVRDLLLNLAEQDLFSPRWSELIQDEWVKNLLLNREDLVKAKLERTVKVMNKFFPNALVHSFEFLIDSILIPDPSDRHVVAAAIYSGSSSIVTFNLQISHLNI